MLWLASQTAEFPATYQTGLFILAGTSFLVFVDLILRIIDRFKPQPPLHRQFAKTEDLQATNQRLDKIEQRLSTLREEIDSDLKGELRRLYDALNAQRTELNSQFRSLSESLSDLERAVGVLEGRTVKANR